MVLALTHITMWLPVLALALRIVLTFSATVLVLSGNVFLRGDMLFIHFSPATIFLIVILTLLHAFTLTLAMLFFVLVLVLVSVVVLLLCTTSRVLVHVLVIGILVNVVKSKLVVIVLAVVLAVVALARALALVLFLALALSLQIVLVLLHTRSRPLLPLVLIIARTRNSSFAHSKFIVSVSTPEADRGSRHFNHLSLAGARQFSVTATGDQALFAKKWLVHDRRFLTKKCGT